MRLGWLLGIATFIPTLFFFLYLTIAVAKLIFLFILILIAMVTLFLIFLNEGFRNAFNNMDIGDLIPLVQKVYTAFNALIPIFFFAGIALAVLSIFLSIKAKNGNNSFKRLLSSIGLIVFLVAGIISYYATNYTIMGIGV